MTHHLPQRLPQRLPQPLLHHLSHQLRSPLLVGLLVLGLLGGCREAPEVVVKSAREALERKDTEAFLKLVDAPSQTFLRRSLDVVRRSGQAYEVFGAKHFAPDLLPAGELVEDPQGENYCIIAQGKLCVVEAKQGRKKVKIPLRLVRGQWRIALLDMEPFLDAVLPR